MRRIILWLLVFTAFYYLSGCGTNPQPAGAWREYAGKTPYDTKLARTGIFLPGSVEYKSGFRIPVELAESRFSYLKRVARYIPDQKNEDVWQTPLETSARGGGDCEDLAAYFVDSMGADAKVVVGRLTDRPGVRHVWVEIDGVIYDLAMRSRPLKAKYHETRYVPVWAFDRNGKYKWELSK